MFILLFSVGVLFLVWSLIARIRYLQKQEKRSETAGGVALSCLILEIGLILYQRDPSSCLTYTLISVGWCSAFLFWIFYLGDF